MASKNQEKKLYAEWHHIDFRPKQQEPTTLEFIESIAAVMGKAYSDFEPRSSGTSQQYNHTMTFNRLIDIEFKSVWYQQESGDSRVDQLYRVVIHGDAFIELQLDTGAILTAMEQLGFVVAECHTRLLLPPDVLPWATIDKYFAAEAYASDCSRVNSLTDPSNGYAKTWQAGARPAGRSQKTQGKRLTFYEAHKIHPELPKGTSTMELQLFGASAQSFIYGAGKDFDLTVKTLGVVRTHLEFKTLTGAKNKSTRAMAPFWSRIIDNFSAIHLPRLQKTETRLTKQLEKFDQMLLSAYQRLGATHFTDRVAAFANEKGLHLAKV